MDLRTLANNFGIFLDVVEGPAKLKKLILELAIKGKLTPTQTKTTPVQSLLDDIEEQRLVKKKTLSKLNFAAPRSVIGEVPFPAPMGWNWSTLGFCGRIFNGNSVSDAEKRELAKVQDGIPFVATKDVGYGDDELHYENGLMVQRADPNFKIARSGAVLVCAEGGSAGKKCGLTKRDICFGNKLFANECWDGIDPQYVLIYYQTDSFFQQFSKRMTGIIGGIALGEFLAIPIPIPPPEEQNLIVSETQRLIRLCDELEQKQEMAAKARSRFNAASLEKLVTARDADEFDKCWGKVRENFNLHFQSPECIPPFKEALLMLAVQGRLVPQNSADESAHDAESKLEAFRESEKQPKSGTVAKSDLPISEHELPFPIPSNWTWIRLGTLAELITKGSSPRWQGVRYVDPSKEAGLLFITSTNVLSFELDLADPSYVEPRFNEIEPRSILRRGDFLMNLVGASIGRTAIYDRDDIANINQAVCLIRPLSCSGIFDPSYLLTFFNSPACIRYMFDKQVDMARANLSMTNVARFLIPLPPLPEQVRIVHKIKQISNALTTMSNQFTDKLSYENRLAKAMCRSALEPNDRMISPTESDQSTRISGHEVYTCN